MVIKHKVGILFEVKSPLAEKIVEWIWKKSGLDPEDESWCSLMFDDAVNEINKLMRETKEE